jgi:hypothetical protein
MFSSMTRNQLYLDTLPRHLILGVAKPYLAETLGQLAFGINEYGAGKLGAEMICQYNHHFELAPNPCCAVDVALEIAFRGYWKVLALLGRCWCFRFQPGLWVGQLFTLYLRFEERSKFV